MKKTPTVYLAAARNGGERMALRPVLDGEHLGGAYRRFPCRVVYRWCSEPQAWEWRYSCRSAVGARVGDRAGCVIGDGSDEAALRWLLDGEVAR